MEVIDRKENPLLGRVEIRFQWEHTNSPTPSLKEMVAAAAKAEPGAKENLVFLKEVKTRFGRPQTTGLALVYGTAESAALEPDFVKQRHSGEKKAPKAKPVKVESAVEEPAEESVEEQVEEAAEGPAEEQSEGGDA
ncbi:MAG: hypothetical protein NZ778_14275 [Arenicellales bacterium]|nr:hypothetical protein [Arenicellales bacterium]|tara:strand:+ start:35141 stop:35548 length:408 start_codon:yes stop_codon:yes gene_type:complete